MKSEILMELEENIRSIRKLISNRKLTVGDADKFLQRAYNIHRKLEDLERSRDIWREKYKELLDRKSSPI